MEHIKYGIEATGNAYQHCIQQQYPNNVERSPFNTHFSHQAKGSGSACPVYKGNTEKKYSNIKQFTVNLDEISGLLQQDKWVQQHREWLVSLVKVGINTVNYSFYSNSQQENTNKYDGNTNESGSLYSRMIAAAAFDLFILRIPDAQMLYSEKEISQASAYFQSLTAEQLAALTSTLGMGSPLAVDTQEPSQEATENNKSIRRFLDYFTSIFKELSLNVTLESEEMSNQPHASFSPRPKDNNLFKKATCLC